MTGPRRAALIAGTAACAAALPAAGALAGAAAWRWAVHATGSDYTGPYGHLVPYSFWSGVAGSFLVNAVTFFFLFYAHRTCHYSWWCWRWAHVPVAGGVAATCHRHAPHPDLAGRKRPRGQRLHDLHFKWERERGAR